MKYLKRIKTLYNSHNDLNSTFLLMQLTAKCSGVLEKTFDSFVYLIRQSLFLPFAVSVISLLSRMHYLISCLSPELIKSLKVYGKVCTAHDLQALYEGKDMKVENLADCKVPVKKLPSFTFD